MAVREVNYVAGKILDEARDAEARIINHGKLSVMIIDAGVAKENLPRAVAVRAKSCRAQKILVRRNCAGAGCIKISSQTKRTKKAKRDKNPESATQVLHREFVQ